MAFASQEHEQATYFRFGTDNHLSAQNERSGQRAVKFGAVAIDRRIDGIEHSHFQDCAFGKGIQCISGRWIETGLQMKLQDSAGGNSHWRNSWSLRMSGSRKQTEETQNCSEGMAHGLGLSSSEKREQHNNSRFARRDGQRESRQRVANSLRGCWSVRWTDFKLAVKNKKGHGRGPNSHWINSCSLTLL